MKLSELVNFYNQLCAFSAPDICREANNELSKITSTAQDQNLNNLQQTVLDSFERFSEGLEQVKQQVLTQIRQDEKSYIQNSYRDYEEAQASRYQWFDMSLPESRPNYLREQYEIRDCSIQHHIESMLNDQLDISDKAKDLLTIRIQRHSGWLNSGMIIHPGRESWIGVMAGNDPLYLVDEHYDLLKPAMSGYSELYQSRLRTYIVRESLDQDLLPQLPDNQFGVVLIYNYFDYKPFEIIQKYLTELYRKVRPGGTILMTFNDCDRWPAVKAVEVNVMSYTPGWMIRDWARTLGFEITFDYNENGSWSWLELHKPGEFHSLRGGQTLAKIMPK